MEIKTIDAISDTHQRHGLLKLPGGDLLLHTGDISSGHGSLEGTLNFIEWLSLQPYRYKIWIPGNHDFPLERDFAFWKEKSDEKGLFLLNDSGVTLEGVRIWGAAVTPWFHNWAFNRHRGEEINKHWSLIPEDTEILLTHGPVAGILDMCVFPDGSDREAVGCEDLLSRMLVIPSIKLHVCGHIHEARGHSYKHGKTWVNASSLDSMYAPWEKGFTRIVKDSEGGYSVEE